VRVLSIATLFPNPVRPGFGVFVGNQMRAVAQRGDVDLTVISPIGTPPWPLSSREPYARNQAIPAQADTLGLPVRYPRFRLIPKIGGDGNPRRIVRAILPMVRALHRERPFDLVDAQFFFPDGPAAAIIASDLGLPLTIKSRGADIHYWGLRAKARAQMLAAAEQSAGLLAVSQALRDDMIAMGMPGERIAVHYTGLDHARFRPVDRGAAREQMVAHGIGREDALLLTPGALIARKGQALVLEALAHLPGARLALAGAGEDEGKLRNLAHRMGMGDRVHFMGQVGHDVLPTLMAAADVMVLPSASEGLANVWVEALACGTPIVVPDVGGARELVRSGTAGRLVEREPSAIAKALREILAAPPAQADVAAEVEHFSWERNAEALVGLWADAINRTAAKAAPV
jgi:teichuronic acid biosynthesis glycosyltransferase TuaC